MRALISWFAGNSVASNLLMALLLIGGISTAATTLRTESFPEITPENISVAVFYPGATPEEIEESICVKIEEAVEGLEGVDRIVSQANENLGTVNIEIVDGANIRNVLDDVKNEVDAIDSFPDEADEPIIRQQVVEERVVALALYGDTTEHNLKVLAENLRDELLALRGISKVELEGDREYEVSIYLDEVALQRFGFTLEQVAAAIRNSSINLPAGSIDTRSGEIIIRSDQQAYTRREFETIPVIHHPDGSEIQIEDVATVDVGFEDNDRISRFDGKPAMILQAYRVGKENTPKVAALVKAFCDEARSRLPQGVELSVFQDRSKDLDERIQLLRRNGLQGLCLVFLVLALFLRARLALWVAVGLTAALFGALWVLPLFNISLNFLSSFGFILVLGILVDDAIVVGENIDAHTRMGKSGPQAARDGTWEVMVPVCLAVFTTAIAFSPMLDMPGRIGDFVSTIAMVVIISIFFSLVESLLILPNHLSHESHPKAGLFGNIGAVYKPVLSPIFERWNQFQGIFTRGLEWVIENSYRPTLEFVMRRRYLTAAMALGFLIITAGLMIGGRVKLSFFPAIEGNDVIASVRFQEGTPLRITQDAVAILESATEELRREFEGENAGSVIRHVRTNIGDQPATNAAGPHASSPAVSQSQAHLAEVHLELVSSVHRPGVSAKQVSQRWRDLTEHAIFGADELNFKSDQINVGAPINLELSGKNIEQLETASEEIKNYLATLPGIFNIADDFRQGKEELDLEILPSGLALGLTQAQLTQQVRGAFFGNEAQRVQLGPEDVKVYVRYPREHQRSLVELESMRLRLPGGIESPFTEVATYHSSRGPATIQRIDRQRTIVVTSDLNLAEGNANEIVAAMQAEFLPDLLKRYPTVSVDFGGEQERQAESFQSLFSGMVIALFMMFALLAVVFRSYIQPLIILTAIPFGVSGAIWAHYAFDRNLTFLSMIGILALMGVVVNDSLVLIDFINRYRREHKMGLLDSIREAGPRRFRPILLTSLTTFAGLLPILTEQSVQAAFVIPMALSLAFGVAVATGVILVIVPAGYLIVEDFRQLLMGPEELGPEDPDGSGEPASFTE